MQSSVEFRNPFTYDEGIIIIFVFLIVAIIVYLYLSRPKKEKIKVIIPPKKDLNMIKKNYLQKLDSLLADTKSEKINYRSAYLKLSKIIRDFIFEATNINVSSVSLAEVKGLKMPQLYELMEEYYAPEFARFYKGDIESSIEKTRGVITRWK